MQKKRGAYHKRPVLAIEPPPSKPDRLFSILATLIILGLRFEHRVYVKDKKDPDEVNIHFMKKEMHDHINHMRKHMKVTVQNVEITWALDRGIGTRYKNITDEFEREV